MTEAKLVTAKSVTAALLVIGDEILSGRTKDKNIGFVADYLTNIGIDLREVRVVPDIIPEIVDALNAMRARYTYVFTTGGIGPTHDDLTAEAVAAAFGVEIAEDPRVIALLLQWIKPEDLNEARRRMARIPRGAELVENAISKIPGFWIGNVIVMAGVPAIMQAMLTAVGPKLEVGPRTVSQHHRRGQCRGRRLCGGSFRRRRSASAISASALIRPWRTAATTMRSSCAARMKRKSPQPRRRSRLFSPACRRKKCELR